MKKLLPILLIMILALTACGQSAEKLTNQGNEAYAQESYDKALQAYQQALKKDPELSPAYYNAANALYRQGNYTDTAALTQQALETYQGEDPTLPEHSLYNQGNAFFLTKKLDQAIESFKAALRLNPADTEAKENLELALLQKQQQEQQQQQQNQDQQNQDQQNQDQQNKDQQNQDQQNQNQQNQDQQNQDQQNQDQQNQDQQNQDQQNQDQQNQDQQNQDQQNQDQQNQDQQNQDQQNQNQQPQPDSKGQMTNDKGQIATGKLTEQQARQLLQAAAQGTKSLEQFLQQIYSFAGPPPAEDW